MASISTISPSRTVKRSIAKCLRGALDANDVDRERNLLRLALDQAVAEILLADLDQRRAIFTRMAHGSRIRGILTERKQSDRSLAAAGSATIFSGLSRSADVRVDPDATQSGCGVHVA
jgi:hypothetical protein